MVRKIAYSSQTKIGLQRIFFSNFYVDLCTFLLNT